LSNEVHHLTEAYIAGTVYCKMRLRWIVSSLTENVIFLRKIDRYVYFNYVQRRYIQYSHISIAIYEMQLHA